MVLTDSLTVGELAARDDVFPDFSDIFIFRFVDQGFKEHRPNREDFVSAVMGGGQLGYQHQFGHWVFGIEGDIDRTSIRNTQNFRGFTNDEIGVTVNGAPIADRKPWLRATRAVSPFRPP